MGNSGLIHWPKSDGPLAPDFGQHNLTGVPLDELTVSICVFILLIIIALFFIFPSFPFTEKSLFSFFGACLALFVLVGILLGLFGYNWAEDKVTTTTAYKAFSTEVVTATVGVKIGLTGLNITLEGVPHAQHGEYIDYNNYFSWEWHQHRDGYSKYAGRINQEFRAAQFDGVPLPILWVAEYFVLDGEEIIWGRFFRFAGFYTHYTLLFALRCWVMAVILAVTNLKYSGYFFIMTSAFILLCNVLYSTISATPINPLLIPFEGGVLAPRLGWNFYLNLAAGLVSFVLGLLMVLYAKRNLAATRTEWALRASARAARIERWRKYHGDGSGPPRKFSDGGHGHSTFSTHTAHSDEGPRLVSTTVASEYASRFSSVDRTHETVHTPRK